ncbi:MAG: hypothetical protein KBD53_02795 [Candidatus Omnitrophica bacterium]|nr:hypothetical protein [Candidatus Omnitrophota bacterium]
MKNFLILSSILFLLSSWSKPAYSSTLTQKEVERVKVCKKLFNGIDGKTLDESITLLEENTYPKENLILLEAMAKTYAEMVEEQNVVDIKKKEWLYSMVKLNMAYLQLGGYQLKKAHAVPLHQVIQTKLKSYIPVELMENRDLFNPLEF